MPVLRTMEAAAGTGRVGDAAVPDGRNGAQLADFGLNFVGAQEPDIAFAAVSQESDVLALRRAPLVTGPLNPP